MAGIESSQKLVFRRDEQDSLQKTQSCKNVKRCENNTFFSLPDECGYYDQTPLSSTILYSVFK